MPIQFVAGKPESNQFHVEPGDYALQVVDAKEDTSKAGNDQIKLKLRVIREDGTLGVSLFDYLVVNDKCRWKIDAFLKSCDKHPGEGNPIELDASKMIGWECNATLKVESFEGVKNNKVATYLFEDF